MHMYKGRWGTTFFVNSDFSGDAIVRRRDEETEFKIPAQDLLDVVAEHVRSKKIAELEDLLPAQLLGLRRR